MYHNGPRSVLVQVCLALAGLALQLPEWQNPVGDIIQQFGTDAAKVPALLQFLTILPEEMASKCWAQRDHLQELRASLQSTKIPMDPTLVEATHR